MLWSQFSHQQQTALCALVSKAHLNGISPLASYQLTTFPVSKEGCSHLPCTWPVPFLGVTESPPFPQEPSEAALLPAGASSHVLSHSIEGQAAFALYISRGRQKLSWPTTLIDCFPSAGPWDQLKELVAVAQCCWEIWDSPACSVGRGQGLRNNDWLEQYNSQ